MGIAADSLSQHADMAKPALYAVSALWACRQILPGRNCDPAGFAMRRCAHGQGINHHAD